jgi:hypothetical protein
MFHSFSTSCFLALLVWIAGSRVSRKAPEQVTGTISAPIFGFAVNGTQRYIWLEPVEKKGATLEFQVNAFRVKMLLDQTKDSSPEHPAIVTIAFYRNL